MPPKKTLIDRIEDEWFAGEGDEKAQREAAESMAALVARMHGVRPFPMAAQRVLMAAKNPDAKVSEIARYLEGDPALATRVLKLVNSASYAPKIPCKTIHHAIVMLGLMNVGELATAAAVIDLVGDPTPASIEILTHTACVAAVSRRLAHRCDVNPDEMFTIGLLHDIGKLMLLQSDCAAYLEMLENPDPDAAEGIALREREVFGFDHGVLAGHLLSEWRIPKPIPQVVAWHHRVARAYKEGGRVATMTHVLRLADRVVHLLRTSPEEARASLSEEALEGLAADESASYLSLNRESLDGLWGSLVRACKEGESLYQDASVLEPRGESERPSTPRLSSIDPVASGEGTECYVCGDRTFGQSCPRCDGELCSRHAPERHDVCGACEEEYEVFKRDASGGGAPALALAGLFALAIVLAGVARLVEHDRDMGILALEMGSLSTMVAFLACIAVELRSRWTVRARFLATAARHPTRFPRPESQAPTGDAGAASHDGLADGESRAA